TYSILIHLVYIISFIIIFLFFFFSSRRRHTRSKRDWSSDVCSSDLSLLLGHSHPQVTAAVAEQVHKGTHYGACHELEVAWAEQIGRLIPSAEWVRFTMSGTEATMLAMRDARAFTGRELVIRFAGHFHGWHDYAMAGYQPPFDTSTSTGVPKAVTET